MKKLYGFGLITAFICCTQVLHAQQVKDSSVAVGLRSFLKITLDWKSGLEWEQKISKTSVISLFAGVGIGKQNDGLQNYFAAATIVVPDTYAEYRSYYNLLKRVNKRKKTFNNSANFLYGRVETYYAIKNQNYFGLLFSQGWGAQRSICKRINVDCHLGIFEHFYYDKPPYGGFNYMKIEPDIEGSFIYVF